MSDLMITVAQLAPLAAVLAPLATLSPPPNPKGRYVLAKVTPVVMAEHNKHEAAMAPLTDEFATQDAEGNPVYRENANGTRSFTVRSDKMEEWLVLQSEEIILPGVRMITRAEFGNCPITVDQEMVLVSCGLLEDAEPA